ncbi:MAG TPA: LysR family transcriptional regulator, partial [Bradyrhizobium sp.]|nr:LysR family transcriptional regulator [Bradyrhizobium sp.]
MNRAAERVGRSQSAVSQQMRKLEEKVGQRLFRKPRSRPGADRTGRAAAQICPPNIGAQRRSDCRVTRFWSRRRGALRLAERLCRNLAAG